MPPSLPPSSRLFLSFSLFSSNVRIVQLWINDFKTLSLIQSARSLIAFIKSVNCEKEECVEILKLFRRMKKHQADGIFHDAVSWTTALNKNPRGLDNEKSAETTAHG